MEKLLLQILCIMSFCGMGYAQSTNWFQDGMSWTYHVTGTSYPEVASDSRAFLEGEVEIGGYKAVGYWVESLTDVSSERKLYTYLRADGEKVYFLANEEASEWKLLYDFGMRPGETATVWSFNGTISNGPLSVVEHIVECEEITQVPAPNSDLMEMKMRIYYSDDVYDDGTWIKGIGCPGNPMMNVGWIYDGVSTRLLEAMYQGEVLYSAPGYSSVELAEAEGMDIKVGKGSIVIRYSGAESPRVFTTDGIEIVGTDGCYSMLSAGIYHIVVSGKPAKSVIVP